MGIDFRLVSGITALSLLCGSSVLSPMESAAADKKPKPQLVTADTYFRLADVGTPRISPDGRWIAYTVTTQDLEADESSSRIWMVPAAGGDPIPLSAKGASSSSPRWSPDGKYLGFLSARDEGKTQVWTLFRDGGEAVQRTDTAQGVTSFEWSPDGAKILLVMRDPKPEELEAKAAKEKGERYEAKTPPPWVVAADGDKPSAKLLQITTNPGPDGTPRWSPDGTRIAHTSNTGADATALYETNHLAVSAAAGGESKLLTQQLDRMVFAPRFSKHDDSIYFLLEVEFRGKTAHAAADPWNGRSALDGVELFTHAINLMREHVQPTVRMHYVIADGGNVPNVVPDYAKVWCWVRDSEHTGVDELVERARAAAEGAALATGTEGTFTIQGGSYGMLVNLEGAKLIHENMGWLGPVKFTEREQEFAREIQRETGVEPVGLKTDPST
jgi:dipeptidyl aminopeptidase/acylaminoacyl peptidase